MTLLLEAALKGSVVLLVGLAATRLLRRRHSAAARHWLLATAIASAAAVPLAVRVAPPWAMMRSFLPSATPSAPTIEVAYELPGSVASAVAPLAPPPPRGGVDWLVAAWLAGVVGSLGFLADGLWRLRAIGRTAAPLGHQAWERALERTAAEMGVSHPVRLLCGPRGAPLVTWGSRRPVLLVPDDAREWSEDRIAVVLRHELAHVLRRDWAVQLIAAAARAAYWFNPLMWIASARLRQESEHACDDVVLGAGVEPADYATHLVELARAAAARRQWVPAQSIIGSSQLQRRVSAMLHSNVNRRPVTPGGRIAPMVAMLVVTMAIAGFGRAAQTGTVLSGTVTDPMGRAVPGVTVALADAGGSAKHEVRSDAAGRFSFVPLPGGSYTLRATLLGFKTVDENVTLAGGTMTHDLALQLGMVEETIRVSATPSTPKPSTTTLESRRERANATRAADACAQSEAGGCVLPPTKLKDVRPVFPESLKGTDIKEPVVLRATIATDGSVRDITLVSSPYPELTVAAMDAVRQWEFSPTQLNGAPIETAMRVTVRFEKQ